MKNILAILVLAGLVQCVLLAEVSAEQDLFKEIELQVTNPTGLNLTDAPVKIDIDEMNISGTFNPGAFIVYNGDEEIAAQHYVLNSKEFIIFVADFNANETKTFTVKYFEQGEIIKNYKSRVYAELAMKFDSEYNNKKFVKGKFENFSRVIVPGIHTDHDALFKYEGPGWESEKVGYRFYLDWRNASDIFGKKVSDLVLHKVGKKDVTAENDSYHVMQDWGMDIFKVGNSLGIGSFGMMVDGKIIPVSDTKQLECVISCNGPVIAEVQTSYSGWKIGSEKYDLKSSLSIIAGSRITSVNLNISEGAKSITTGIAKYEGTEYFTSSSEGDWQYIALYGKQTLNNDNLGLVLFYKKSDLVDSGDDELNYFVTLKFDNGKANYKYAAAWELEPGGIKNIEEFKHYVDNTIVTLNTPIKIKIQQVEHE